MPTKIGDMAIYISANTYGLARELAKGSAMVGSFASSTGRQMATLAGGFASFARDVAAFASGNVLANTIKSAAGGLVGLVGDSIHLAAEMEKTTVAFEVLTGSAEKTRTLMKDIKEFAAESPLSLAQTSDQVKKLLAAGVTPEQAVPTVSRLSDLSVGDPAILERLSYAYGQVRAAGRLYGTELKQFTETGIPLIEELGKVLGKPTDQVKKLVEEGRVGFYELQLAIKGLTDKGGKFYGMTEKYAQTFAGKWERTKDAFDELKRSFGTAIIEEIGLKDAAGDLETFADSMKPVIDAIRPLIRFVGDLGKGLAQLAAEGGKAFFQIGESVLNRLHNAFPETARWIRDFVTHLKDFKFDPEGIAQFAQSLGEGIVDAIHWAKPYWDSFVDDFVIPITDVIKSLASLANSRPLTHVGAAITGNWEVLKQGDAAKNALATEEWRANLNMRKHGISREDAYDLARFVDLGSEAQAKRDESMATSKKYRSEALTNPNPDHREATLRLAERHDRTAEEMRVMKENADKRVAEILARGSGTLVDPAQKLAERRKAERARLEQENYDKLIESIYNDAFKMSTGDQFTPEKPLLDARLSEMATKLQDKFVDPLVKFAADSADLNKLKEVGRLDERTFALAYGELVSDLAKDAKLGAPQLAAGAELGSTQLASMLAQAGVGTGPQTVEGILEAIRRNAEEQLNVARQIASSVSAPPVLFTPPP